MFISSAALLEGGEIVAAVAEERLNRIKLDRSFPLRSIEFCLDAANAEVSDIEYFATSWNPAAYFQKYNPLFSGKRRHLVEQLYSVGDHLAELSGRKSSDFTYQEIPQGKDTLKIYHITHHRAHAAYAFYLSGFEKAAYLTSDSQGEFESTTWGVGQNRKIETLGHLNYPNSIAALYGMITEFLGFQPNSDEWKVMALGSYAERNNSFYKKMKDELLSWNKDNPYELNLNYFKGHVQEQPKIYSSKLLDLLGECRHRNDELDPRHYEIASALQQICEEAMASMLRRIHQQTKEKKICLAGGFFMNSVFNGKVLQDTPFEDCFIGPAPDDSGNCLGSSLYLYHHILEKPRKEALRHNYFGPEFNNDFIGRELENRKIKAHYAKNVEEEVAKYISDGKIVGWFQGRMEFGQRALGNRSILADPRNPNAKKLVNAAVKFREAFRPFAPAVLIEKQNQYFDIGDESTVPFMEKVLPVLAEKQAAIPAVVHADGSGRIQSVSHETNPKFHGLIEEFEKLTGIPILLNTSFNLNGEPIVCSPRDALKTFYNCGLDILVLGNYIIIK